MGLLERIRFTKDKIKARIVNKDGILYNIAYSLILQCEKLYHRFKPKKDVLYMTLLVKDEEDIIRENILFHHFMGVDGFIVTCNNCSDNTVEILNNLKKHGICIEIIEEPEVAYNQHVWVDRMIRLAKDKYDATWVINADADEFWYAVDGDLKCDINKVVSKSGSNVLKTFMINFCLVENKKDFLNSTYFINRSLLPFEMEQLGVVSKRFSEAYFRTKVIHTTKGYKQIAMGNHSVEMDNIKENFCPYIKVYHYIVRNYNHFEQKVLKGIEGISQIKDESKGKHWRLWYSYYKKGKLKEAYEKEFALNIIDKLFDYGVVVRDNSVANYLKYIGVLKEIEE